MTNKPDFPTFIDSSGRKAFAACPIQFYYCYVLKIKPIGVSIHLHFGSCFAKGLEVFRKSYYGSARLDLETSIAKGTEALIREWGDFEPEHKAKKTLDACIDCLFDYFVQYPPDKDPVKPLMVDGEPAVEFSFALPIPGIMHPQSGEPVLYVGRFDMLAEYNAAKFIDDEKTATSLGDYWASGFRLASQVTGYIWAGREYGHEIMGAVIRGVSPLKSGVNHSMLLEYRPQWMIDRWLWQLQRDVRRMIEMWESSEWDYNLDGSCGSYGGCDFLGVCESKDPSGIISIDYEPNLWDPLEKTE